MITFEKKPVPQPLPGEGKDNRFEQVRKAADEGHRKAGAEASRRRARQSADDLPLIPDARSLTPKDASDEVQ